MGWPGVGVEFVLLSNAVTLKPSLELAAHAAAPGGAGGQQATEEGERIEALALGLWLARARIRPDEQSRAGWLCGFFL
jgi:hypothetical protein